MRTLLLFLFISTIAYGQRTLINIDGNSSFEIGGQYMPGSFSTAGIYTAYNGPLRLEVSANKYTSSFDLGTEWGARLTFPLIKQSTSNPFNFFVDGEYVRFQQSGFSSNTLFASGILSHKIRSGKSVISPYGSAGYIRSSGNWDFKWTVGGDIQIKRIFFGAEHGRIGSSGTTYLRFGFKFGENRNVPTPGNTNQEEEIPMTTTTSLQKPEGQATDKQSPVVGKSDRQLEREKERQRLREEGEKFQRDLEKAVAEAAEARRQAEFMAAENAAEEQRMVQLELEIQQKERQRQAQLEMEAQQSKQQRIEAAKLEQLKKQQAEEAERAREEVSRKASAMERGNFVIQFFASTSATRSFQDLTPYGTVFTEVVSGQSLYRYLLGYYQTQTDAERIQAQLRNMGYKDAFVKEIN